MNLTRHQRLILDIMYREFDDRWVRYEELMHYVVVELLRDWRAKRYTDRMFERTFSTLLKRRLIMGVVMNEMYLTDDGYPEQQGAGFTMYKLTLSGRLA